LTLNKIGSKYRIYSIWRCKQRSYLLYHKNQLQQGAYRFGNKNPSDSDLFQNNRAEPRDFLNHAPSRTSQKLLIVRKGSAAMLYTIAVIMIILWLLGLVTSYTMGGFIHILLVIAIVVVLLRVIEGRKVL